MEICYSWCFLFKQVEKDYEGKHMYSTCGPVKHLSILPFKLQFLSEYIEIPYNNLQICLNLQVGRRCLKVMIHVTLTQDFFLEDWISQTTCYLKQILVFLLYCWQYNVTLDYLTYSHLLKFVFLWRAFVDSLMTVWWSFVFSRDLYMFESVLISQGEMRC